MVKAARTSITVAITDDFGPLFLLCRIFVDFRDGIGLGRYLVQLIHGRCLHDVALSTIRRNLLWKMGRVKKIAEIKRGIQIIKISGDSYAVAGRHASGGVHDQLQSASRRSRMPTATANSAAPTPTIAPKTGRTRHTIVLAR